NEEMDGHSSHCSHIAHIGGDGFVTNGIRRMQITKEVTVLREQIGTENKRMGRGDIENGSIVTDRDNDGGFESLPYLSYEAAFTEIAKRHTMASTPLRKRRGEQSLPS